MKKVLFTLIAVLAFGFAASAQNNAIGLRFGGGDGYGAEISYQQGLGANRVELDLGFGQDNFFWLSGIYQWTFDIAGDFGWYVGVGGRAGYCKNHDFGLAVLGQVGVEFHPQAIPLQFTIDVRPGYEFLLPDECYYNGAHWGGAALGVRYRF